MIKKCLFYTAIVAATTFGVLKANDIHVNSNISNLKFENIEALADPPEGSVSVVMLTPCVTNNPGVCVYYDWVYTTEWILMEVYRCNGQWYSRPATNYYPGDR